MSATVVPTPAPAARRARRKSARELGAACAPSPAPSCASCCESKDFWMPMVILGGFFFVIVPDDPPARPSRSIGNVDAVQQVSDALKLLPEHRPRGRAPGRRPVHARSATSSPCTCSPRSPWSCPSPSPPRWAPRRIVGERERGTGEFLAHSPAGGQGDLPRQADRQPGARLHHDHRRASASTR